MEINLIYGPPGTGKTTELLRILERELETHSPDKIAYVSFTRKGTYEGRDRAMSKFGMNKEQLPYFKTIHSLAFRAMKIDREEMIDKTHYKKFSEALGMKFTGFYTEDLSHDDDRYLFFSNLYRNNPSTGESLITDLNPKLLNWVTNNYKKFKEKLAIYDYTDLLEMYLEDGEPFPIKAVIIDEAQDLTTLQWQFIWKAFKRAKVMYIAGDDDQAIYEWSGADVNYFLNLKGNQTILHKSWRLPKAIHEYASRITEAIGKRIPKEFTHNGDDGVVTTLNSYKELTLDNENSWMILSRNTSDLNKVETWLKSKALVYTKKGVSSVNPDIVKTIKAHHKKSKGQQISANENLLLQFYMEGAKSYFEKPWFEEFCRLKEDTISYYRDLIASNSDLDKCNISLSTIHGSKGGEADNVVLLLQFNKRVSDNLDKNQDSEMRCYYVGATRAKKRLFLVLPEGSQGYPHLRSVNE